MPNVFLVRQNLLHLQHSPLIFLASSPFRLLLELCYAGLQRLNRPGAIERHHFSTSLRVTRTGDTGAENTTEGKAGVDNNARVLHVKVATVGLFPIRRKHVKDVKRKALRGYPAYDILTQPDNYEKKGKDIR